MKITILADSEAMPRGKSWGDLSVEATYPYQLERSFRRHFGSDAPYLSTRGLRLRTTREVILDWTEAVELPRCEFVIVQVGGGDCAPRVFLPHERDLLKKMPLGPLRTFLFFLEKRFRRRFIRIFPNRAMVGLKAYRENILEIIRLAEVTQVRGLIFINIPAISDAVEHQLPGARAKVRQYNESLESVTRGKSNVRVIDLYEMILTEGGVDALTSDGTHLNAEGQKILTARLERLLVPWIDREREALARTRSSEISRIPERDLGEMMHGSIRTNVRPTVSL